MCSRDFPRSKAFRLDADETHFKERAVIVVAGKVIKDRDALSLKFRTIAGWTEGTGDWLDWMMSDGADATCTVRSEEALLKKMVFGLYASRLAVVRRLDLVAHPMKLTELSESDVETLDREEASAEAVLILRKYGIETNQALLEGPRLLAKYNLQDHLLFQARSLSDSIALHRLSECAMQRGILETLGNDAATFAAQKAQSIDAFCDLFLFYSKAANARSSMSGEAQKQAIDEIWTQASSDCSAFIQTFAVKGVKQIGDIDKAIRGCLQRKMRLGFITKSSVLRFAADNDAASGGDWQALEAAASSLILDAEQLVLNGDFTDARLSQDGETITMVYSDAASAIEAGIDFKRGCGTVTFGWLRARNKDG